MVSTNFLGIPATTAIIDINPFGIPFEVSWAFLNSMWPLGAFCLVKEITGNNKTASLATVLMLFFAGREISRLGSIGTSLGYLLIMAVFFLYLKIQNVQEKNNTLIVITLITSIAVFLTHIITAVFIAFFVSVYFLISS